MTYSNPKYQMTRDELYVLMEKVSDLTKYCDPYEVRSLFGEYLTREIDAGRVSVVGKKKPKNPREIKE